MSLIKPVFHSHAFWQSLLTIQCFISCCTKVVFLLVHKILVLEHEMLVPECEIVILEHEVHAWARNFVLGNVLVRFRAIFLLDNYLVCARSRIIR